MNCFVGRLPVAPVRIVVLVGAVLLSASPWTTVACRRRPDPSSPVYTATIKDLMLSIIDPSADVVWGAVSTSVTKNGIVETVPRTEDEWDKVRSGAVRLAEATNLLMMPGRRVARPGEVSEAPGIELEPGEIEERVNADRETWNTMVKALLDASLVVLPAIDAHDPQAVLDAGERIEFACETCHSHYWYLNQPLPPDPRPSAPLQ